jgi:CubicO group peptidase (beta-lactamase class C family)
MPTESAFAHVARTLEEWEGDRDCSGSFLVTRGGESVFEHSCGYADRAAGLRNGAGTRFGLASLTKMFTAATVARLVGAGGLAFQTPVADLLSLAGHFPTLRPDVTVHHLLCHSSGIADYFEEAQDLEPEYADLWRTRPCYTFERPADFLPLFGDLLPYRSPGEVFQYSNAGYIVLGLVIEQVTGSSYAEAVQAEIFEPAGMAASGFFRLDEPVTDMAHGYLPRDARDAPWRTNIYSVPVVGGADGGAFSTAADIDRFLRAYSDGSLLGGMTSTVLEPHMAASDGFFEGYGVHLYPDGRWGHGGGDPGVEVIANRWPDEDLNVIVLCNTEGTAADVRDLLREAAAAQS